MTIWRNLNIGTKVLTALLPLILLSIALVSSISILIAQRELEEQALQQTHRDARDKSDPDRKLLFPDQASN